MKNFNLISEGWEDYVLLDSGGNRKLEKFGNFILVRPEPQAVWKENNKKDWEKISAEFLFDKGKGKWIKYNLPEKWSIKIKDFKVLLRTNFFKHLGIFPEQFPNWLWAKERVNFNKNAKVLNLFGYTGIVDLFLAASGANVVHIDSSKQSNAWALENAKLANLENKIKILLDDALKFSKRELRRRNFYDGIILDPPSFGRGPKGEVWKIEKDLPQLLDILKMILRKEKNSFFLLNSYAAGYSPFALKQLVEDCFADFSYEGEFGELQIKEANSSRILPQGIYVRFVLR